MAAVTPPASTIAPSTNSRLMDASWMSARLKPRPAIDGYRREPYVERRIAAAILRDVPRKPHAARRLLVVAKQRFKLHVAGALAVDPGQHAIDLVAGGDHADEGAPARGERHLGA